MSWFREGDDNIVVMVEDKLDTGAVSQRAQ